MLFITKLVLHKCKRFYVKGIETFEITPSMKTQIILGTNGSGKSSLLKIGFTPISPHKDDFHPEGYKELHGIGRYGNYEIRNFHNGKNLEHSFILNGEELNEGKTAGVQKELVKEHFNMYQELHDVLTGTLKFTSMSPQQRREWITRLSSADFDYVINLHGRVKKGLRDQAGYIKLQGDRLLVETGKKMDDGQLEELRREAKGTLTKLSEMFTLLDSSLSHESYESIRDGLNYTNAKIESTAEWMLRVNLRAPEAVTGTSLSAVEDQLSDLRDVASALRAALHEVSEQHQLIDKQIHEISILDGLDPVLLQSQLTELEEKVSTLQGGFKTNLEKDLFPKSSQQLNAVNDVMAALYNVMSEQTEVYSREAVFKHQTEMRELQDKLRAGTSRVGEIEYRLNHIANCSNTQCPNCNHVFKEGVTGNEEAELRELLTKGQNFKVSMDAKIEKVRNFLEEAKDADDRLYALSSLRDSNPSLAGLWNLFNEHGGVTRGRELIPVCRDFLSDANRAITIDKLTFEIAPIIEKLNQLQKLDKSGSLRELHLTLSNRIMEIQRDANENQATMTVVKQYLSDRQAFENAQMELDRLFEHQRSQFTRLVDFTANEEVNEMIKRYQVSLAMLESTLTEAEMQAGIVNDLRTSLEGARHDEESLKLLEKILSPKDGLIAEQILVFVNTFIRKINEVIGKVWGYNLALENLDLEQGELDCKFPMYIHHSENKIPDIALGSDSIVDIVNQAFRIVVYEFMELEGYPLYLDEPARAMDGVHSNNLIMAMKDMIDNERFSQVFYISHSFEGQNSFPNSQIAVLDDSHVTLKRRFNEHVTIT